MKLSVLIACLFLSTIASAQPSMDVLHYRFSIQLNDQTDAIKGVAEIRLIALTESISLDFDLVSPNAGKGMGVTAVDHLNNNNVPLRFRQDNERLQVWLRNKSRIGDTLVIRIQYGGVPADGLIISKTKFGRRSFFADNWPNRGHNWLPCNDQPSDKASVEFLVTAPSHYNVVSNGLLVEESKLSNNETLSHWREDVPIATKVMVIGVAEFAIGLAGMVNDCVPVYSYVYPENKDKGFYEYEMATAILPFFIKTVGPYGYKKLANVQSKTTFGGLENANTIFYSEASVTGSRKSEALIAHEIAHQWFGNMATEKSFAHLWLSEGFATYMTILYMENKYGRDTAVSMLQEDRSQVVEFAKNSNSTVVNTTSDYMALLNANSYQKGGWILHMLRSQLGDSVFYQSIREYYRLYAGKNADTKDLQTVFEKVSGKDLSDFFGEWLYMPGVPRIDVKATYTNGKITINVKQRQNNAFRFPLEIGLIVEGRQVVQSVQVTEKEQTFSVSVASKPTKVTLDPGTKLLFQGKVEY